MKSLLKMELIRASRNKKYLIMSIGMPVIFYLLFTTLIKVPQEFKSVFNRDYLMSMTTFSLTNFSIFSFPLEIIEDRENGWKDLTDRLPINTSSIIFAKMIKMITLFLFSIILVFSAGRFGRKVKLSFKQWIISGFLLLVGAIIFLSLGTIISTFKDEKTASVFANLLYLILALVGGLWFPTDQFPKWLQYISKVSPTYHFRELAVKYVDSGNISYLSIFILLVYGFCFLLTTKLILKYKSNK